MDIYHAWRGQHLRRLAGPVFTPLGEASVYPAWWAQHLSRLQLDRLPLPYMNSAIIHPVFINQYEDL